MITWRENEGGRYENENRNRKKNKDEGVGVIENGSQIIREGQIRKKNYAGMDKNSWEMGKR